MVYNLFDIAYSKHVPNVCTQILTVEIFDNLSVQNDFYMFSVEIFLVNSILEIIREAFWKFKIPAYFFGHIFQ